MTKNILNGLSHCQLTDLVLLVGHDVSAGLHQVQANAWHSSQGHLHSGQRRPPLCPQQDARSEPLETLHGNRGVYGGALCKGRLTLHGDRVALHRDRVALHGDRVTLHR